jgi:tetratricopeptide (TPR) repeat protein
VAQNFVGSWGRLDDLDKAMVTSGKIQDVGGLQAVLQMVSHQADSQLSILRIISNEGAGRLAIANATFITGAQSTSGAAAGAGTKTGLSALQQLLAVKSGIYEYGESQRADEFAEVDEGLQIPIAQFVMADSSQASKHARETGTAFDATAAGPAGERRKAQFQPNFKSKASPPAAAQPSTKAPADPAVSRLPNTSSPAFSADGGASSGAAAAGFLLQPDLPEEVKNRQQAWQAEQAANARRQAADPAGILRRTAQKLKSRLQVDKESMEKSADRTSEVTRLKALSDDQSGETQERRPGIDKATIMGAIVTVAVLTAVIACKLLADMASPGEQMHKAESLISAGQSDAAISALSLVISKQPDNVQALCLRAKAYETNGQKQNALEDLNKVVAVAGTNAAPDCLFRRAQVLFDLGSFADALSACNDLLKVRPHDANVRTLLGMADARSGSSKKALEELSQAPSNMASLAAMHRGFALWKLSRLADAIDQYKIASRDFPQNASVFYELGMVESQAGKLKEAKADLERAQQLDPRDGRIRISLSDVRQHLAGQPSSTDSGQSALKLGLASYDSGKFQQAAAYLKAAAEKGQCDSHQRSLLASALKRCGETAAAYQQFLALAATGALPPADQISFAQCASSPSMLDDCIAVLTQALETNPQSIQTRLALILSYKKAGQREYASRLVDEGMQITQSSKDQDLLRSSLN